MYSLCAKQSPIPLTLLACFKRLSTGLSELCCFDDKLIFFFGEPIIFYISLKVKYSASTNYRFVEVANGLPIGLSGRWWAVVSEDICLIELGNLHTNLYCFWVIPRLATYLIDPIRMSYDIA